MTQELLTALYIAASVLFILSLGGLSDQEKAKKAVWYGIIGMIIAIFGTILGPDMKLDKLLIPALVVGSIIGLVVALKVQMTGMPQLVAALHSFVGLAAVFIGINSSIEPPKNLSNVEIIIHEIEIFLGVFIGAITFTGSVIAYGKLSELITGKALIIPGTYFQYINDISLSCFRLYVFASIWFMDFNRNDYNSFYYRGSSCSCYWWS